MQQARSPWVSFILYLLGFLLFWEWLRPLQVVTATQNVTFFVSFAAFSFLMSYLRFPMWITFPAKLIAMLFALHVLFFYNTSLFNPLWITYFLSDLQKNISFIAGGNWVGLTDLFRSFLFFVLLWIISYLMHYWLIQTRRLFLFFFVTLIYLTVLDTFTMYHADGAIVRTMVIGLILLGLLRLLNVQERERVTFKKGTFPVPWLLALVIMIGLTATLGFTAPKVGPQWPDPVPFIQKAANGYGDSAASGAGGTQKIGYDSDDTRLGGAFQMDNTPVFRTTVTESHYWKIETKDTYTGKGWVDSGKDDSKSIKTSGMAEYGALSNYEPDTKLKQTTAKIDYIGKDPFPQLIYGGEPQKITGLPHGLSLDTSSGKLEPMYHGRHETAKQYTIQYDYPTFSLPELKKVTGGDPEELKARYTQLPKELPDKVRNLAEKITKNEDNRYDKAKAIADWFGSNPDFTYDTQDVAIPKGSQDYVAQFLFDTKKGYCDNYSSSTVVMLRTLGIPARWVKGFTQGAYEDTSGSNRFQFIVKNSDAHSWVEVYFPGSGWVPFEPTKGFNNIYTFDKGETQTAAASGDDKTDTTANKNQQQAADQKEKASKSDTSGGGFSFALSDTVKKVLVWTAAAILTLIVLAVIALIFTRRKWLPGYMIKRYEHRKDKNAFDDAFNRLLRLLKTHGLRKDDGQTLREFATEVDQRLGTKDMVPFALEYEKNRYRRESNPDWQGAKVHWKNIISRLKT